MPNTKPYIAAACICEKVLIEQDSVASVIRIIDTLHVEGPAEGAAAKVPIAVNFQVFVSVKAGDLVGSHEIGLVMRGPTGDVKRAATWPVVFAKGPEGGANLKIDFNLFGKEPGTLPTLGLYWFDVLWGEEVLTSIPLMLRQRAAMPVQALPRKP
jgi:hypothetical protein